MAIKGKLVLRICAVFAFLGACASGALTSSAANAKPPHFCHFHQSVHRGALNRFSFAGGGALLNPNMPAQFLNPIQKQYLSYDNNEPLNTNLYDLAPPIAQIGTNCNTDLYGSGINPGASTITADSANYGVKVGSNALGYLEDDDDHQLSPSGMRYDSNSGFVKTQHNGADQ